MIRIQQILFCFFYSWSWTWCIFQLHYSAKGSHHPFPMAHARIQGTCLCFWMCHISKYISNSVRIWHRSADTSSLVIIRDDTHSERKKYFHANFHPCVLHDCHHPMVSMRRSIHPHDLNQITGVQENTNSVDFANSPVGPQDGPVASLWPKPSPSASPAGACWLWLPLATRPGVPDRPTYVIIYRCSRFGLKSDMKVANKNKQIKIRILFFGVP